jgi:hypothetical protein
VILGEACAESKRVSLLEQVFDKAVTGLQACASTRATPGMPWRPETAR